MFKGLEKIGCKSLFFCFILMLFSIIESNAQQFRLNEDAIQTSCDCYELTQGDSDADRNKDGSAWSLQELDLSQAFELNFRIYLGDRNGNGADGMAFVLQQSNSLNFVSSGGGLGFEGINTSLGLLFDTFRNASVGDGEHDDPDDPDGFGPLTSDHISLHRDGNFIHGFPSDATELVKAVNTRNLENGLEKDLQITWDPSINNFVVFMDGVEYINYTGDIINNIFSGDPIVTWGFTAATGYSYNQHYFCTEASTFLEITSRDTVCVNTAFDFTSFDNIYNEEVGTWSWDFGDATAILSGTGSTITAPTHIYTVSGDYTAKLMYDNAFGTCPQEQEFNINVTGADGLSISASSTDICYNESVDITIGGTGSFTLTTDPPTFSGILTNGVNSINLTETMIFTVSAGTGMCTVTDDVAILVGSAPTFTLDDPLDVCDTESTNFNVSNSNIARPFFEWQLSEDGILFDNGTSDGTTYSVTLPPERYYMRVVQSNGSCIDTSNVVSFEVLEKPTVSLSSPNDYCYYNPVTLNINTGGGSFTFTSEPNYTGILVEGDNEILLTDSTKFIITAGTGSCEEKDSIEINIIEKENIVLVDVFDNICEGIAETFGAGLIIDVTQTNASSVRWQVSHDGVSYLDTLGTNVNESLTVLEIGDYYFRAIYDRDGCSDTSNVEFFDVDNPVNLSLPTDLDICEGDNAVFNIVNDGTLSTITIPDKGISVTSGVNNVFIDEHTNFLITANDGGCLKTDSFEVNYIEDIALNLSNVIDVCEGEEVTLSVNQNTLSNYQWQVSNDGLIFTDTLSSVANVTLTGLSAGTYYFKVKHIQNSCESESNVVSFEVKPIPELTVLTDVQVCLGSNASLMLSSTGTLIHDYIGTLNQGANSLSLATDTQIGFEAELNGCKNNDTVEIAVIVPTTLTVDPISNICEGEDALLNVQQKGLSNYQWQVSHDGTTFVDTLTSIDNLTLISLEEGSYSFRVKHGAGLCESISDTISFDVNVIPELSVFADAQVCSGIAANLTLSSTGALTEDFGGLVQGTNSISLNSTTEIGFETELNGCKNNDTLEIVVVPEIVLTVDPISNICEAEDAILNVQQIGLTNYQWEVSHDGMAYIDTLTSNADFILTGLDVDTYYFRVNHISNGCDNISNIVSFEVNVVPELSVSADAQVCSGTDVNLILSSTGTLIEDFGGLVQGTNSISLNSTTEIGFETELNGCKNNDTVEIVVVPLMDLSIDPVSNICIGENAVLKVTPTGLTNYQWQVSHDGLTFIDTLSSNDNFTLMGLNAGDYFFRTSYDDGACTSISDTINFGVIDIPTLSVTTPDNQICNYETAQVEIQTTGSFVIVSSPVVNTSSFMTGINTVSISENTMFTVIAGATGCEIQNDVTINVVPKSIYNISSVLDVCEGTEVSFGLDDVSITSVDWESHNGDGIYNTDLDNLVNQNLTLTPNNYNYRSLYIHDGCIDTSSNVISFDVNAIPELTVTADAQVCSGTDANITISREGILTSDYIGTIFNQGNNSISLVTTTQIAFETELNGCENNDTVEIIVIPTIDLIVNSISNICEGEDVLLTVQQTGLSNYQWEVSHDGTTFTDTLSSNASFTLAGLDKGNYFFRVSHSSNGCNNVSNFVSFDVNAIPELTVTADAQVCSGTDVNITISREGMLNSDYTGTTFNEGLNSISLVNTTQIAFETELDGCKNNDTVDVVVISAVVLTIDPIANICEGEDVLLNTQQIGLSNYQWEVSHDGATFTDTLSSNANFTLTGLNAGNYYFKVLHIDNGCVNESTSVNFNVIDKPELIVNAPTTICFGNEAEITLTTTNDLSVVATPVISDVLEQGINNVILEQDTDFEITYGPTGCEEVESFSIAVIESFLEIRESNSGTGDDFTVVQGETFTLDLSTNTNLISWYINDSEESGFSNTVAQSFSVEDNSVILVQGELNGCKVEDQLTVSVIKDLMIPKVLTPNGNGSYDVFEIKNLDSFKPNAVTIYNRWGSIMYQTKDGYEAWDGMHNGTPAPNGTYYYVIDFSGDREDMTGYFTLMK